MKKDDIKDLIKWALIGGGLIGGGDHIKDFAKILFEPLLDETRQIRLNQETVIYNQHVEQYQRDGFTLDESIEKANQN